MGDFSHGGSNPDFSWNVHWYILQCRGCEAVFCKTVETDSESYIQYYDMNGDAQTEADEIVSYWPARSKRKRPVWIEEFNLGIAGVEGLSRPLTELYQALDNDLTLLATIGARTVFDVCSNAFGIDPSLPFEKKLDELVILNKIDVIQKNDLEVLVEAGNASIHRGWLPKTHELDVIMDILEHFLNLSFVEPERRVQMSSNANKLKGRVPPRPSKKPKAKSKNSTSP